MTNDILIDCPPLSYDLVLMLLASLQGQNSQHDREGDEPAKLDKLSRTERRVLRYLPTNLSRPAIAREMYVSVNTINTHIRNIYSKLAARSRAEAVDRARDLRLIAR